MAQVVRYGEVDLESLLSQAKETEKVGPGKVDIHDHAFVPAGKLNYVPPNGWEITPFRAELIGSHTLHVDGKYPTEKLQEKFYDVSFVVELKDNFNIKTPVITTLTLPDGTTEHHEYLLMEYPRNIPFLLKAGDFFNKFKHGDIVFTLNGSECKTWKEGLVIYGVRIQSIIMPVQK